MSRIKESNNKYTAGQCKWVLFFFECILFSRCNQFYYYRLERARNKARERCGQQKRNGQDWKATTIRDFERDFGVNVVHTYAKGFVCEELIRIFFCLLYDSCNDFTRATTNHTVTRSLTLSFYRVLAHHTNTRTHFCHRIQNQLY